MNQNRLDQSSPHLGNYLASRWLSRALGISFLTTVLAVVHLPNSEAAQDIFQAASSGNIEQLQHLVIGGSDVNQIGANKETPLTTAALAGQVAVVNYLLQRGATANGVNANGLTPLHAAAYAGHDQVANLLLSKGADVNNNGNRFGVTPLHMAAEENHQDVARVLLKGGADPGALEVNGYSPVSRAGWREHWEVVTLLLSQGGTCQDAEKVGDWLYEECSKRVITN